MKKVLICITSVLVVLGVSLFAYTKKEAIENKKKNTK